jgi:hypothetical protein
MLRLENLLNQAGEWIIRQEFASYSSKRLMIKQFILHFTELKGLWNTVYGAGIAPKSSVWTNSASYDCTSLKAYATTLLNDITNNELIDIIYSTYQHRMLASVTFFKP